MGKRMPTGYKGVFYRMVPRLGGPGEERAYYAVYKREGKAVETMVGRQHRDGMTEAKANNRRSLMVEGKAETRQEGRERKKSEQQAMADRPTIARLWELYKEARPDLKGIRNYESCYKSHISPVFADKTPAEIDPLSITRFKVNLAKRLAPKTTSNALELLRRIINFGVAHDLCESKIKINLPIVDNLRTEDLSPEQLAALLGVLGTASNQAVANIMRMALFTGMRCGEILKLKWEHLDFERGFVYLHDPKGGVSANIPMNPQARNMLLTLPRESEFVFPGRGGEKRVAYRAAARKLCAAAGLPKDFRPLHGLRHAYASMLASSGQVDLYTLQRLLTHKTASMTQRYAHLRDEVLQRGANVAGQIMEDAQAGQSQKVVNLEDFKKG
jgi:integrase